MQIHVLSYDDPVVRMLEERVQAEYVARYGGPDASEMSVAGFEPPAGGFLVGWVDGEPVACGGFRAHEDDAEIKRMYVPDEHRGYGYARALLAALEERARAAGYRRMILETGDAQPEALALYTSSGYTPIPGFGIYRCAPQSKSFAKALPD